jgi:hypothetical protein
MRLTIEIVMENDAFEECHFDEVHTILTRFLAQTDDNAEMCEHGGGVSLSDSNGNKCGYARVR